MILRSEALGGRDPESGVPSYTANCTSVISSDSCHSRAAVEVTSLG